MAIISVESKVLDAVEAEKARLEIAQMKGAPANDIPAMVELPVDGTTAYGDVDVDGAPESIKVYSDKAGYYRAEVGKIADCSCYFIPLFPIPFISINKLTCDVGDNVKYSMDGNFMLDADETVKSAQMFQSDVRFGGATIKVIAETTAERMIESVIEVSHPYIRFAGGCRQPKHEEIVKLIEGTGF